MLSPLQVLDIESACRGLFPPEPKEKETLLDDTGRTIHYRNCSDETGEFKLCVTEKPDGFIINRVVGHFAVKDQCTYLPEEPNEQYSQQIRMGGGDTELSNWACNLGTLRACSGYLQYKQQYQEYQKTFRNIAGSKAWFKDTYSFNIDRTFNCSYFSFYGIAKSKD